MRTRGVYLACHSRKGAHRSQDCKAYQNSCSLENVEVIVVRVLHCGDPSIGADLRSDGQAQGLQSASASI